jgi:hypothetical protein
MKYGLRIPSFAHGSLAQLELVAGEVLPRMKGGR